MYLYLGSDEVVRSRDVVGIFDLDNASLSARTRQFLAGAEREGKIINAAEDIPKSFVVTGGGTVVLAQPNTAILVRRMNEQENNACQN